MSAQKPYISVIIPSYNRAAYIADAIRSVLEQKDARWPMEIIVVDDGSTDDTEKIVAETFGKQVKYVKIAQSGGRPAIPRNAGIATAQGELIAFQDSDDLWAPDKLATQIPLFEKDKNVMLSFGTAEVMNATGKPTGTLVTPLGSLEKGERFNDLVKENVISTLTVVARKSALEAVGGFDESAALGGVEDYELWLRLATEYPKGLRAVKSALAYYRQHENNISTSNQLLATTRLLNVYNSVWDTELTGAQRTALESQVFATHANWGRIADEVASDNCPMISVVMSVYNGEKFLRPAVESILNQTFRNFEFIIIDDGSSDSTSKIIQSYNDPRIRLIRQTNHKLVASLNRGIELARGEFIARMDHDDISLPSRFEKEVQFLCSSPHRGLVGTYFTYIDEATSKPSITLVTPIYHTDLRRMMYIVNPFAHGSTMYRKDAIIQAGMYRDTYGPTEDYDLWRRIVKHWQIGQIPEPLYLYRLNPGGISHQNSETQNGFAKKITEELWAEPFVYKPPSAIVRDLNEMLLEVPPVFRETLHHMYTEQQAGLAIKLFDMRHFNMGLRTAVGAIKLDRSQSKRLWRPIASGFVKRLGKLFGGK